MDEQPVITVEPAHEDASCGVCHRNADEDLPTFAITTGWSTLTSGNTFVLVLCAEHIFTLHLEIENALVQARLAVNPDQTL